MDNGINNTEQAKDLLIYYVVLAAAAILVLVWYFFVYPNRNLPAKPSVKPGQNLVKVRDDQKSASNSSNQLTNTQLEDTANSLKNAPKFSDF